MVRGVTGSTLGPRPVDHHQLRPKVPIRLVIFAILAGAAFVALLSQLYSLQVTQGRYFAGLANGNRVRQETIAAPRGVLYDRHGMQLVSNRGEYAVAVGPADLPTATVARDRVSRLIKASIGMQPQDFERAVQAHLGDRFQPFTLKSGLDDTAYEYLTENVASMPGVRLVTDSRRQYVTGAGLSHLLGYVGKLDAAEYGQLKAAGYGVDDVTGKTGLEFSDEHWLRGQQGSTVVEVNAQGQVVRHLATSDPVPGDSIYLTIDINLQRQVATDLQAGIDRARRSPGADTGLIHGGAAIVSNPKTGEIYSMVSLPDYDLNQFAGGITQAQYQALTNDPNSPLLNRAIDGQYPPGSTIKPVVAAAALQAGVITPDSLIFDPGHYLLGGFTFYGWNRSGFGNQNVVQAIAHSDDIFFYETARRLGDGTLARYAKDFGLGQPTGLDIGPQAPGVVPDSSWKKRYFAQEYQATHDPAWLDSTWYPGDTITYGIGQSYLLVTPLQDLMWMATIASGGSYMRPQLTGRVRTPVGGDLVRPFQPEIERRVTVAQQNLALVREGLREAVALPSGTAYYPLHSLGVPVAGKTGTAQFGTADARGNTPAHAWFSAYGPTTDPEVAVTVFIEGGGEGATFALPVADQILQYYFAHKDAIRAN